jgi:hypothetical protein
MAKHEYKPLSIEQLRLIRIPKADILPYAGYGKQDVTLEVQPLDDSWIADNARSVDEVDMAVEKSITKNIIIRPDRTMLRALSIPCTSVIISLMEKITGITKIATLAFNWNDPILNSENVFAPKSSATMRQKM